MRRRPPEPFRPPGAGLGPATMLFTGLPRAAQEASMNDWTLRRNHFDPRPGPVLVVVMDGVGIGRHDEGDAVHLARTPALAR